MTGLDLAFMRTMLLIFFAGIISLTVRGQSDDLAPVTRAYVIKNVNITQSPGRKVEMGAVVIQNGVITAVGKSVKVPAGARVIEADSMYVYAGFIDGLSNTGVPKPKENKKGVQVKDPGNPPNDIAGIEPQRDVRDLLNPKDPSIDEMRRLGFTVSHTVPYGRMLPGNGAIILLAGKNADEMVYAPKSSLYSQLSGAPGIYPSTVMGVMAKYRELYRQAKQAKDYEARYKQAAIGMERPSSDRVLEAFYPVIDKKQPVLFRGEDVLSIQRILDLKDELGFDLILAGIKQGWDVKDKLKSSGAKLFLSLNLPEEEEAKADSTKTDAEDKTVGAEDAEKQKLEARKEEMLKKYYEQPANFQASNIPFGFSTKEAKSKDIRDNLLKLMENGLTEDAALAALTTAPAQLLGLSQVMGTVDQGKMANLVVSDKPYFTKDAQVKYVFVDGQMFEYKEKPKSEAAEKQAVDITGKWTYSRKTPQGVDSGDIMINGKPGDYTGTISSSISGDTSDLTKISVDGNEVSFSFTMVVDGNTITVEVIVTVDGDTFKGTATADEQGSHPIEGERAPEK